MSSNVPEYHFSILSQLLRIVTSNAVGRTGFSLRTDDDDPNTSSLQDKLLSGIASGKYRDDAEASRGLYNADPTDQRYMTLRSRCIDRLLNEIRHIDITPNQLSEYTSNYFKCIDLFRVSKTLGIYGNQQVAEYALMRSLSIARRYGFTIHEFMIRGELAHKSLLSSELSTSREHHMANLDLIRTAYYELITEMAYDTLFLSGQSFEYKPLAYDSPKTVAHNTAMSLLDDIEDSCRSHTVWLYEKRMRIEYAISECEYERALEEIDSVLAFYQTNSHLRQNSRIGEFMLMKLEAQIYSRNAFGTGPAENPAQYFHRGKTNWCISNATTIYSCLYRGEYERGFLLYVELKEHFSDAIYSTAVYEHRMLLEAYLWILTSILPASEFGHPDPQSKIPFRESTFLNAMNVLESNKYGSNALIVIAHVFILLIQDKEKEAYRRILNLNVYATRYLKGESEQRLWYCIKALQKVPSFRTRPHMMREAMEPQIARIRRLADLPMKNGFNELVPWDVLLEAYIAWEIERSRSGVR